MENVIKVCLRHEDFIKFQKKSERNSLDFQTTEPVDAGIDLLDTRHGKIRGQSAALGENLESLGG